MTAQRKQASTAAPAPAHPTPAAPVLADASTVDVAATRSPAHAYQAALEAAWNPQPKAKYPLGVRLLVICGGSVALWAAAIWAVLRIGA